MLAQLLDEFTSKSRKIELTGEKFAPDEELKIVLEKVCEGMVEEKYDWAKRLQPLQPLYIVRMPLDFRRSIFNNCFRTIFSSDSLADDEDGSRNADDKKVKIEDAKKDDEESDEKNENTDGGDEKDGKNKEVDGSDGEDDEDDDRYQFVCNVRANDEENLKDDLSMMFFHCYGSYPYGARSGTRKEWMCDGRQHKETTRPDAKFKLADAFGGFVISYWQNQTLFCDDCAKKFSSPLEETMLLELMKLTMLPKDIIGIVADYCKSPFSLLPVVKYDQVQEKRSVKKYYKDDDLVLTSVYYEWVKFLTFDCENLTTGWFINCNPNSPFYGRVLSWCEDEMIYIEQDILQFEKDFLTALDGSSSLSSPHGSEKL